MLKRLAIISLLSFFLSPSFSSAQARIHFYSYRDALIEKTSSKMVTKGGEDPAVQDLIKKYWESLTSKKVIVHTDEDGPSDPISFSQAAKDLQPKPKDKLWVFIGGDNPNETKLLGTTRPISYRIGDDGDAYEITFDVDRKPLEVKCQKTKAFLDYAEGRDLNYQWWDFERYEALYVSVPPDTPDSSLPKPIHVTAKLYQPLLDKINTRLETAGINEKKATLEMAFQALGEKYVVVLINKPWDYCREVYQVTKKGFRLVYRNSINTAATD